MFIPVISKVWLQDFNFLKFRSVRQHSECATCVKHKCLIRSLGHHLHARQAQLAEYHSHLDSQYQDRLQYWSLRGISRARGSGVTIIIDGMDQSKFCYPRHRCLKSKEFQNFQRPRAHIVGMLIHGRAIIFAVSEPDVHKDASTHVELLAFALTKLEQQGVQLAELSLRIQCDNTPREVKNNVVTAYLTSLVSKRIPSFDLWWKHFFCLVSQVLFRVVHPKIDSFNSLVSNSCVEFGTSLKWD